MYEFDYTRPDTLEAAVALLRDDPEAKCLAGGMTLVPTLKQRLAMPSLLVDLGGVARQDIAVGDDHVEIGAGARHADVAGDAALRAALPALAALAGGIGDPMVRNRGTIGGSLANNDPAADYPAALLALGGEVVTTARRIPAQDFITGMFETALAEDEIVTAIRFRRPDRAGYAKFRNPASGYAVAGVFVARFPEGPRVAVTGAGPCAHRDPVLEAALARGFGAVALEGVTLDASGYLSDIHADAAYRAALVLEMCRRAVASA